MDRTPFGYYDEDDDDEDEVLTKYIEDCEAQDPERLRQGFLIAEAEKQLSEAARLAELAVEKLLADNQAKRRGRLRGLASALRDERDTLRFQD